MFAPHELNRITHVHPMTTPAALISYHRLMAMVSAVVLLTPVFNLGYTRGQETRGPSGNKRSAKQRNKAYACGRSSH